jgi:hypothetical protein
MRAARIFWPCPGRAKTIQYYHPQLPDWSSSECSAFILQRPADFLIARLAFKCVKLGRKAQAQRLYFYEAGMTPILQAVANTALALGSGVSEIAVAKRDFGVPSGGWSPGMMLNGQALAVMGRAAKTDQE